MIESFSAKLAKWGVDLKPHQTRAHARLRSAPGVLVYHGLGSGKTITSITGADSEGRDAVAVVPAALRNNCWSSLPELPPPLCRFGGGFPVLTGVAAQVVELVHD